MELPGHEQPLEAGEAEGELPEEDQREEAPEARAPAGGVADGEHAPGEEGGPRREQGDLRPAGAGEEALGEQHGAADARLHDREQRRGERGGAERGGGAPAAAQAIASGQSARASSRSRYFWTLPLAVIGKPSTNVTYFGIL